MQQQPRHLQQPSRTFIFWSTMTVEVLHQKYTEVINEQPGQNDNKYNMIFAQVTRR